MLSLIVIILIANWVEFKLKKKTPHNWGAIFISAYQDCFAVRT